MALGCCPLFTFSLLLFYLSFQPGLGSSSSTECNRPLGLQDGRISNSQLSSPNHFEHFYIGRGKSVNQKAEHARLNNLLAWCSPSNRHSRIYIEIDLTNRVNISGIATQGFSGINAYYVKQYKITYSTDGVAWKFYNNEEVLAGNTDPHSAVKNTFNPMITARYIRVYPESYNIRVCMRLELYGWTNCPSPTSKSTTDLPKHQTNPTSSTLSRETTHIKETGPAPTTKSVSQPEVVPGTTVAEHQTTPTSPVKTSLIKETTRTNKTGPVKTITPTARTISNQAPGSNNKANETLNTKVPWSASSQKVSAEARQDVEPLPVSTKLVIAFSVTAVVVIIFMAPVTIFLIFLRHRRRGRFRKCPNGAGDNGIPLATAGVYESYYDKHYHDNFMYVAPTGKCSTYEMDLLNRCAV